MIRRFRKYFKPSGPTFASVVPPDSLAAMPLDDVAQVILRGLAGTAANATITRDLEIQSWARSYPPQVRTLARQRLSEAWQRLENEGLIAPHKVMGVFDSVFVTTSGQAVLQRGHPMYGTDRLLPAGLLNPRMATAAAPLFHAGRYEDACVAAFRELEIHVRELSGLPDVLIGVNLMQEAFKPNVGPLTLTNVPIAEQEGVRQLFAGAFGYYRNPLVHRRFPIEHPAAAASIILLANELLVTAVLHKRERAAADKDAPQPPPPNLPGDA
jgi:uncharacterized protein (TIGR02391 family)